MKTQFNKTHPSLCGGLRVAVATIALTMLMVGPNAQAEGGHDGRQIVGNWYLALDAGPFDPNLAGTFLAGLAQFHRDRTFMLNDAGDFGAASFLPTFATAQYGSWRLRSSGGHRNRIIEGTAIHLEAHRDTGELLGWNKVQFSFHMVNKNRAEGTINAFFLPCTDAPPFPTPLTCPDPVENAGSFFPASPPDVPITLTRIVVGQ